MNSRNCLLGFLFAISPILFFAQTTHWFVDSTAIAGLKTGTDWANAMTDLHQALDASDEGDTIWVAKGTYLPDSAINRRRRFELKSGVRLMGGFNGTELLENERNWTVNQTILSGDIGIKGDSLDNSFTILYMGNPDSSTLVDGLHFRFGQADSLDNNIPAKSAGKCGAAIYIMGFDGFAYADIKNCTFEHNYAFNHGGAVFVNGGGSGSVAPRFQDCVFRKNTARRDGGAVYRDGSSWAERVPDFGGCTFEANFSARYGGGLYFNDRERTDTLQIDHCNFIENKVRSLSFMVGGGGAAFYLGRQSGSLCTIDNGNFIGNGSSLYADDIRAFDFSALSTAYFRIENSNFVGVADGVNNLNNWFSVDLPLFPFSGNNGQYSIFKMNRVKFSSPLLKSCFGIEADKVEVSNSIILSSYNTPIGCSAPAYKISNTIFDNAVLVKPDFSFGATGAASFRAVNVTVIGKKYETEGIFFRDKSTIYANLLNCSFIDNESVWDSTYSGARPLRFENCLFNSGFTNDCKNFEGRYVEYTNCAFAVLDTANIEYNVTLGGGNLIGLDPMFRDTANGDYRLLPCSPLIDAGTNLPWLNQTGSVDFDNKPRIQNNTVDIGPYESGGLTESKSTETTNYCGPTPAGSVHFHLENGCPPYLFNWQNAATTGTDTANLAAGNYLFTITDQKGRKYLDTVQIKGSNPTVSIIGDESLCPGDSTGMLTAVVAGAADPVVFGWENGGTTPVLTNLSEGEYILEIIDAAGCASSDTALIEEAAKSSVNTTTNHATGPANPDGSISIDLISGLPPFQFLWSNGDTTGNPGDLLPGDYILSITNGIGCVDTLHFKVDFTIKTVESGAAEPAFVLPNPANDRAVLHWGGYVHFQLSDQLGQLKIDQTQQPGSSDINLSNLPAGIYRFVFFNKSGAQSVGRLVVVH